MTLFVLLLVVFLNAISSINGSSRLRRLEGLEGLEYLTEAPTEAPTEEPTEEPIDEPEPTVPTVIYNTSQPIYTYRIVLDWIPVSTGRLSVSLVLPNQLERNEKFPILLEYLPFRKDDNHYLRNGPNFDYFGKRGYIIARVDIKGTGASDGSVPDREYSDEEIDQSKDIIEWLYNYPLCNGNIGLLGRSWSAFNSLMIAMDKGRDQSSNSVYDHIKTMFIMYGSDDLYYNDIHYSSGVLHFDGYIVYIDNLNALPNSQTYAIDNDYFENRFDQYPWILTYLKYQTDSEWWRKKSVKYNYDLLRKSNISMYMIGGLLDGYRDYCFNIYKNLTDDSANGEYTDHNYIKIMAGPWRHQWPSAATPGPDVEWKYEAVRWYDEFLKPEKHYNTGILEEDDISLYIRQYHEPSQTIRDSPGAWRTFKTWPLDDSEATNQKMYLRSNNLLSSYLDPYVDSSIETLVYVPSAGTQLVEWWNDRHPDMIEFDENHSLLYDTLPLLKDVELAGFVHVELNISSTAPLAFWNVRIEDYNPITGTSMLVTGTNRNGAQRESRTNPTPLVPDEFFILSFDLHFTTWTFPKDHILRIAVSNSLWDSLWPSPYLMSTNLVVDHETSFVTLPILLNPTDTTIQPSFVYNPIENNGRTDACWYDTEDTTFSGDTQIVVKRDDGANTIWKRIDYRNVPDITYYIKSFHNFSVNDETPQYGEFNAQIRNVIWLDREFEGFDDNGYCIMDEPYLSDDREDPLYNGAKMIDVAADVIVTSDEYNFYVSYNRSLYYDGVFVREKNWNEVFPRNFQ